ncbi:MAG TPA: tripartite tricarboxylate transporter TctB family protein [Desulfosalsimonadaceae bacterium]|nr:tripartite tricarboxylate transporter TctB family protein [Desulfosalsimonadaceae bacterium]
MVVEFVASIILLIFSCIIYITSLSFSPQAAVFPKALAIILGALSVIYILQVIRKKVKPQNLENYPIGRVVFFLIALVAYFYFLRILGFYTTSGLYFLFATLILCGNNLTKKNIVISVASGIGFIGLLYFLFTVLLKVQIPRGILI